MLFFKILKVFFTPFIKRVMKFFEFIKNLLPLTEKYTAFNFGNLSRQSFGKFAIVLVP